LQTGPWADCNGHNFGINGVSHCATNPPTYHFKRPPTSYNSSRTLTVASQLPYTQHQIFKLQHHQAPEPKAHNTNGVAPARVSAAHQKSLPTVDNNLQ